MVDRLRNRQVAFLEDPDLFDIVRTESRTEEWALYKRYVRESGLRVIVKMGLLLRHLETSPESRGRIDEVRGRIYDQFGPRGVQAAELVQRGVFRLFLDKLLSLRPEPPELGRIAERLVRGVERFTYFVQAHDAPRRVTEEIVPRIRANSPGTFIVLGHGRAVAVADAAVDGTLSALGSRYDKSIHRESKTLIAMIGLKDERGRLRFELPPGS